MPTKKTTKTTKKVTTKTTKAAPKKAVKKTAKKATVKQTTKAAGKKTQKAKVLVCAEGSDCFWVNEGPILKDLQELEKALGEMTEEVFAHHVGSTRHDFAEWVEHVLADTETAAALRKAKKPHTARKVVVRQLKLYQLPS